MIGRGMSSGVKVSGGACLLWLAISMQVSCDFLSLRIHRCDASCHERGFLFFASCIDAERAYLWVDRESGMLARHAIAIGRQAAVDRLWFVAPLQGGGTWHDGEGGANVSIFFKAR